MLKFSHKNGDERHVKHFDAWQHLPITLPRDIPDVIQCHQAYLIAIFLKLFGHFYKSLYLCQQIIKTKRL